MGILRVLVNTMGRVSTFRSYQFVLLLTAALAVVAFYFFGSERHDFSSTTKRIKQTQASHNTNRNDADLSLDTRLVHPEGGELERDGEEGEVRARRADGGHEVSQYYHALMMFTKVDKSRSLQEKFRVAMLSMAKYSLFLDKEVLVLHFVSDEASRELGERMLPELLLVGTFQYEVVFHDVGVLSQKLFPIVEAMQKHFSAGSGAYYSDAIFFLSVAMHHIMPADLQRIVQLDLDLKYRSNIRELFLEFDRFPPGAVIGIAREMQPVYSVMIQTEAGELFLQGQDVLLDGDSDSDWEPPVPSCPLYLCPLYSCLQWCSYATVHYCRHDCASGPKGHSMEASLCVLFFFNIFFLIFFFCVC
ncbi:xyloside xylosyltransferase 1-like isoform X2 [Oncorhynchus keta]|uniref:xyloside xylosyltransferase 1-like isoform X2 n=1 Tax=Oncorhynchus keta TaxID=8018 RepID=UPI00227C9969|nr:xyloside xylosyltransferase 1-like isoform X2 [Oncorhynchus keta]